MKTYKVIRAGEFEEIWYINAHDEEDAFNIACEQKPNEVNEIDNAEMWVEEDDSINDHEEGLIKEGEV